MEGRPAGTARPAPRTLGRGRYSLLEPIGSGGIATVWRTRDTLLGVERALKLLDDEAGRSPVFRSRFLTEARVMARLEHPNIVRVYDYGNEHGRFFLVMDLVDGGSVSDLLRATRPLPEGRALALAFDVLAALAAMHATDTVHRDIKPGNILIAADGTARLSDFGIVRLSDQRLLHQGLARSLGTHGYMAPEQCSDAGSVGPAADLYAVGATLFAMVTGRHPSALDRLDDHLDGLTPPVIEILRTSTRTDPGERYPDARTMAAAVAEAYDVIHRSEEASARGWMDDLDREQRRTLAHVEAASTRPPPPPRSTTGTHPPRRERPRTNPKRFARGSTVQVLTLGFGLVATLVAAVVLVLLFLA